MSDEDFKAKAMVHFQEQKEFQIRMETAVLGDKDAGIKGLANRVSETEKYISRDKKMKWMGAGIIAFIAWWKSLG